MWISFSFGPSLQLWTRANLSIWSHQENRDQEVNLDVSDTLRKSVLRNWGSMNYFPACSLPEIGIIERQISHWVISSTENAIIPWFIPGKLLVWRNREIYLFPSDSCHPRQGKVEKLKPHFFCFLIFATHKFFKSPHQSCREMKEVTNSRRIILIVSSPYGTLYQK